MVVFVAEIVQPANPADGGFVCPTSRQAVWGQKVSRLMYDGASGQRIPSILGQMPALAKA